MDWRVHPMFGDEAPAGLRAAAAELRSTRSDGRSDRSAAERLAVRYENLADFREVAGIEQQHGQRQEAQALLLEALEKHHGPPLGIVDRQEEAPLLEARQPCRKLDRVAGIVRDGSEISGFTLRHEGFQSALGPPPVARRLPVPRAR